MSELVVAPARHGPFPGHLAPETIAAYAAATGDQTAAVLDGRAVPAVFPVILVFTPQEAARADVPEGVWQHVRGGVHGEHDIVLHRPLVPGERLDTSAWLSAVRTTRAGTQIVVQFEQVGADGAVAVEQWWTMVLLGLHGVADLGTMPATTGSPKMRGPIRSGPSPSISTRASHIVTRRCPATGRRITSTSRWRARRVSTSCSPTDCARWRSAHTDCSACWASRTRPCCAHRGPVRGTDPAGRGTHGECLWHRREFVRLRGRCQRHDHHHPRKIGIAMMSKPEIGVYLPQMGFTYAQILHRTLFREHGIESLWLYDQLYGRGRPTIPRWKPGPWPRHCSAAPSAFASDTWSCATNSVTPPSLRRWQRHWIRSRQPTSTRHR